jgi:menaquinone-dependent protoporphyrinogen oxidase
MKNTLIIYASRHGCTEHAVEILQKQLSGDKKCYNLKDKPNVSFAAYDRVIVGGSIHAGKIQRSVKNFCKKYQESLVEKQLGLFICCMDNEKALEQFNNAYPQPLRDHALAAGLFGGAFCFERMNFIEKAIIKKISGLEDSVDKLNIKSISEFVQMMERGKQQPV